MAEVTDWFFFGDCGRGARCATDITSLTVATGTHAEGIGSPVVIAACFARPRR